MPVEGVVREGDGTMTVWVTADRRRFVKRTVKIGICSRTAGPRSSRGCSPANWSSRDGAVFLSNKLLLGADG